MFSYKKLLQKKHISESILPAEIKQAITELNKLETDLNDDLEHDESDSDDITALKNEIFELDKKICELISEEFDDETDEDETEEEIKETILESLYNAGRKELFLKDLQNAKYPISQSSTIEKVGKFQLSLEKKKYQLPYFKITKLS